MTRLLGRELRLRLESMNRGSDPSDPEAIYGSGNEIESVRSQRFEHRQEEFVLFFHHRLAEPARACYINALVRCVVHEMRI